MPCDISKAERGYRLFDARSFSLRLEPPRWQADTVVDEVIAELFSQLLGRVQRLAEQYRHARQWKLFRELTDALAQLRAAFAVFDLALPRSAASPFVGPLDALLALFQPLVLAGWADDAEGEAARRAAEAEFDRQLEQPGWGALFVELALWLQQRSWTQGRPPRGDRVAGLALERWLLAAVGK
jgi:inorganic triphosphatase YgiF